MRRKLKRSFFARDAIELAPALIGKILVRKMPDGQTRRARIVETEAYLGVRDLASHSSRGRTQRTEIMFGEAGHAYIYFIYGMHWMLNIVASKPGDAQAVLIRAAEPLEGWDANLTGPGRLARGFAFTRADNGLDLVGKSATYLIDDGSPRPRIIRSKRIGVEYSKHWQHRLLRFSDARSKAVSRPWPTAKRAKAPAARAAGAAAGPAASARNSD